jgi:hypothetical protein
MLLLASGWWGLIFKARLYMLNMLRFGNEETESSVHVDAVRPLPHLVVAVAAVVPASLRQSILAFVEKLSGGGSTAPSSHPHQTPAPAAVAALHQRIAHVCVCSSCEASTQPRRHRTLPAPRFTFAYVRSASS